MKLEKATEILDHYKRYGAECTHPDLSDAIELGNKALKRWKERHDRCPDDINFLLPGETTEEET